MLPDLRDPRTILVILHRAGHLRMTQDWWAEHGRAFAEWVPGGVAVTDAVVHDAVAEQLSDKIAKRLAGAIVRRIVQRGGRWPTGPHVDEAAQRKRGGGGRPG